MRVKDGPLSLNRIVHMDVSSPEALGGHGKKTKTHWLLLLFLIVFIGGPGAEIRLVSLHADTTEQPAESSKEGGAAIDPAGQSLTEIEYEEVKREPLTGVIRTSGRIGYDESKVSRISTRFQGLVEEVYAGSAGKRVKKDQPLLAIHCPEFVSTQQELLIALKAKERLGDNQIEQIGANAHSLYESTRQRLTLWGLTEQQMREIERQRSPARTLTIRSPIEGQVLRRNASSGMQVTPETELYIIGDLSTVWVLADIYDSGLPAIEVGQSASVQVDVFPGETFVGKVIYIYPGGGTEAGIQRVRLEFPNSDLRLKPDMSASLELKKDLGVQTTVSASAVVKEGKKPTVVVLDNKGLLFTKQVEVGPRIGERTIILEGLEPGEKIVKHLENYTSRNSFKP
jgi:membrane fusion protein, copper/silver efflux system